MKMSKDNEIVTIALEDDFTNAQLNDFRAMVQYEKDAGSKTFHIDFAGATVIDSMALGCLVATYNSLRHDEGSLRLVNVPESIKKLLQVMRMEHTLAAS